MASDTASPLLWDIKVKIQSPSSPVSTHKLSLQDLLDEQDQIPSFHRLQVAILSVAGETQTTDLHLSLSYLDRQGDLLGLSSQEEWEEALRQRQNTTLLVLAQVLQPNNHRTTTTTTATATATASPNANLEERLAHIEEMLHGALHHPPASFLAPPGTPDTSLMDTSQEIAGHASTPHNKDYSSIVKDHQAALNSRLQRVRQMNASAPSTPTRGTTSAFPDSNMLQDFLQRMVQERHDGMQQLMESRNKEVEEWRQAQSQVQISMEQTLKQHQITLKSMWEQQLQLHTTKLHKTIEEKLKSQAQLLSMEVATPLALKEMQQALEGRIEQLEATLINESNKHKNDRDTSKNNGPAETPISRDELEQSLRLHDNKIKTIWDQQLQLHATKLHKGMEEQLKGQAKLLAMDVVTPSALKEMKQELTTMIQAKFSYIEEHLSQDKQQVSSQAAEQGSRALDDTAAQQLILQNVQKSLQSHESKLGKIWEQQLHLYATKLQKAMEEKFKGQAITLGAEMVTPSALKQTQQALSKLIEDRMDHLEFHDSSQHGTDQPVEAIIEFMQERLNRLERVLAERIDQVLAKDVEHNLQGSLHAEEANEEEEEPVTESALVAMMEERLHDLQQSVQEQVQRIVENRQHESHEVETKVLQISQTLKEQLLKGIEASHESIIKHEKQYASALRQAMAKHHEETRSVITSCNDSSMNTGGSDELQATLKRALQEELKPDEQHENLRQVVLDAHEEVLRTQKESHGELRNCVVEYMDLVQRSLAKELDGYEWEKRLMAHCEQIQAQATAAVLDRLDHLQVQSAHGSPSHTSTERRIRRWSLASGLSPSFHVLPAPAPRNAPPTVISPEASGTTVEEIEDILLSTAEKIEANVESSCEQIQAQATAAILDKVEGATQLVHGKVDALQALVQVLTARSENSGSASFVDHKDNNNTNRSSGVGGGPKIRTDAFVQKFLDLESRSLQLGHKYDCIKNNRPVSRLQTRPFTGIVNGEEKEAEFV